MFCLKSETEARWLEAVQADVDALLADHAWCEKKAAASAMSLIARHPDDPVLVPAMLALAHEELEHFDRLWQLLQARGVSLGGMDKDPYVAALMPLVRKGDASEALVDRLLVSSLIEARSAERFFLLAEHLADAALRELYRELATTEARHHTTFVNLAMHYAPREAVRARLAELSEQEAVIVAQMPVAARMHG
ncbi:MAG: tRNA-(ms[2]io[6]A)-hydroxylase [Candidatus Sericytochromatia bacterium]|nr:tRNA-(ms[2]io[6]A)-hydroxylase [Candidatus Sericytochromatia bacterium]